jgi:1-acyl-sn-glycerol-3-phosphate acyltransferase
MINRVDRRSQVECLKQCGELLKCGASVLFFPEGTRSKDGKMHEFKKVPPRHC